MASIHTPKELAFSAALDVEGVFVCPRCKKPNEYVNRDGLSVQGIVIDGPHECPDNTCEVILPEDWCVCYAADCGWDGTARQVLTAAKKRLNLKPCPHCRGTGLVRDPARG